MTLRFPALPSAGTAALAALGVGVGGGGSGAVTVTETGSLASVRSPVSVAVSKTLTQSGYIQDLREDRSLIRGCD